VFKLISMLGFRGIDIGLFENRSHLQPNHVIRHLAASAKALAQQVSDVGLEFTLRCNAPHMTGLLGANWDGEASETSLAW
jgi:hypothetical protein